MEVFSFILPHKSLEKFEQMRLRINQVVCKREADTLQSKMPFSGLFEFVVLFFAFDYPVTAIQSPTLANHTLHFTGHVTL